ncbi:hypothetical protein BCR34DRAFT_595920 [Clohesyomyces aquaticus]|uniref:Uncharacterized protein n=1 Tax=Clohesyomyces aquaticus TaxID=1231657 RepID=A0A1Y2A884_9PLEO|nr:hypothetical protein BCR34DRAFT_595920 [Clohesyomyces aquaticus]
MPTGHGESVARFIPQAQHPTSITVKLNLSLLLPPRFPQRQISRETFFTNLNVYKKSRDVVGSNIAGFIQAVREEYAFRAHEEERLQNLRIDLAVKAEEEDLRRQIALWKALDSLTTHVELLEAQPAFCQDREVMQTQTDSKLETLLKKARLCPSQPSSAPRNP